MPRPASLRSLKQLLHARWEILLIEICSLAEYATATFVGGPRDNKDTNALDSDAVTKTLFNATAWHGGTPGESSLA